MEEFKPYNNLEAQEEASKLQKKVEDGEVSDYDEAEKLFELEQEEEKEKPPPIEKPPKKPCKCILCGGKNKKIKPPPKPKEE